MDRAVLLEALGEQLFPLLASRGRLHALALWSLLLLEGTSCAPASGLPQTLSLLPLRRTLVITLGPGREVQGKAVAALIPLFHIIGRIHRFGVRM